MRHTTIIVGGVAGGATVAARLSRLDSERSIILLERGPHVSFANCGLPYYIGGEIAREDDLLLASPELFRSRYGIEVLVRHEAVQIRKADNILMVRNLQTGEMLEMPYHELVLAPGAVPFRPAMPGIDLPGVYTLRNVPDATAILRAIEDGKVRSALVVGAGFVGLEVAENLQRRGLTVHVAEGAPHVLPPMDSHMAGYVHELLEQNGVLVETGVMAGGIRRTGNGRLQAYADNWCSAEVDIIILSIGVRPESGLARDAGLETGINGAIVTDEQMRCSHPGIWAVGDAVQVVSRITGKPMLLALAGVAQKQARVAAAFIAGRSGERFSGVLGSSVLRLFGTTIAMTGLNPDSAARLGLGDQAEYVDLHPANHVTYYPGATPIHMRLLFNRENGRILGAAAVGTSDVARRIDVIAAVMGLGGTVEDLEMAELCYSPQEGSAKDAVNLAGMAAANCIRGLHPVAHAEDISADTLVVDVREKAEVDSQPFPGAMNIPLSELRRRWREVPADKPLLVLCQVGMRGYNATRFLCNKGLNARNLTGGYRTMSRRRK